MTTSAWKYWKHWVSVQTASFLCKTLYFKLFPNFTCNLQGLWVKSVFHRKLYMNFIKTPKLVKFLWLGPTNADYKVRCECFSYRTLCDCTVYIFFNFVQIFDLKYILQHLIINPKVFLDMEILFDHFDLKVLSYFNWTTSVACCLDWFPPIQHVQVHVISVG